MGGRSRALFLTLVRLLPHSLRASLAWASCVAALDTHRKSALEHPTTLLRVPYDSKEPPYSFGFCTQAGKL